MLNSNISWTTHTLNFWRGCKKVSPGCLNCYMFAEQIRYGLDPTVVTRTTTATWSQVNKFCAGDRVFVCSWSDFFNVDADPWRDDAWEVIRSRPDLIWIIPTKRPQNIAVRLPQDWKGGWPNVWLLVSVENQECADRRIPVLVDIPASVHGVSIEPMLGEIDLTPYLPGLDWVIVGGESQSGARPMKEEWAVDILQQCRKFSTPFYFKQMGGRDRDKGGNLLQGRCYEEMPFALKIKGGK